jgi:HlyD family secretion protein
MSVVRMPKGEALGDRPVSGGAMDRVVERRGPPAWAKWAAGAVLLLLAAALFWAYAPRGDTQTVQADRLTISPVTNGSFEDFMPLRARVTPLLTVFLDAIEGGRRRAGGGGDGATLAKGQLIAVLSNAELQLSVLGAPDRGRAADQQYAQPGAGADAEPASPMSARCWRPGWPPTRPAASWRARHRLAEPRLVAGRQYEDTRDQRPATSASGGGDCAVPRRPTSGLQATQLGSSCAPPAQSFRTGLELARANLRGAQPARARLRASCQAFDIQVGQSLSRGERIGQIDSPGRNKLMAGVTSLYSRPRPARPARRRGMGGQDLRRKVTKIYPQVKDGQFQVDLQFTAGEPADIQRGQTLQAKLHARRSRARQADPERRLLQRDRRATSCSWSRRTAARR